MAADADLGQGVVADSWGRTHLRASRLYREVKARMREGGSWRGGTGGICLSCRKPFELGEEPLRKHKKKESSFICSRTVYLACRFHIRNLTALSFKFLPATFLLSFSLAQDLYAEVGRNREARIQAILFCC